jgi:hypothetical protein
MSDNGRMTELHNQAGALAHLNMLQAVITRLAGNSSSCKTWCLAVVGAMLGLAGSTKVPNVALLAVLPGALFALLDSMYLARERLYRILFNTQAERIAQGCQCRLKSGSPAKFVLPASSCGR